MANAKKKVTPEQAKALVEKVQGRSLSDFTVKLAGIKTSLVGTLDSVANTTITLVKELDETQAAIDFKKEELKDLHALDVEVTKLGEVIEKRLAIEADNAEYREALEKNRKREQDDYAYNLAVAKRKEEEEWASEKKRRNAQFQADLDAKLEAVEEREETVNDLQEQAANLSQELGLLKESSRKEQERAVAIATNSLKKDLENTHALEKAKSATELALLQEKVKQLESTVQVLRGENAVLNTRLEAANKQVQSIAEKAIEGASQKSVVVQTGAQDTGAKR